MEQAEQAGAQRASSHRPALDHYMESTRQLTAPEGKEPGDARVKSRPSHSACALFFSGTWITIERLPDPRMNSADYLPQYRPAFFDPKPAEASVPNLQPK